MIISYFKDWGLSPTWSIPLLWGEVIIPSWFGIVWCQHESIWAWQGHQYFREDLSFYHWLLWTRPLPLLWKEISFGAPWIVVKTFLPWIVWFQERKSSFPPFLSHSFLIMIRFKHTPSSRMIIIISTTIITIFISTALYHHDQLPVQHDQIPPSPLPSGQEGKTTEDFQETDKGRQMWGPWRCFW